MAKRYIYDDKTFKTYDDLRRYVLKMTGLVFDHPNTTEEFSDAGLFVQVVEYDPIDEMDVEELRKVCLKRLNTQLMAYRNADTTSIQSSLGFEANANITAYNNVDGVWLQAEEGSSTLSEGKVAFMDFDDQLQMLDAEQLKTLKLEISENGSRAYGVKWTARQAIEAAQTVEELKPYLHVNFGG